MKTGIDLGTTYSLISHLRNDGVPVLLPDNTFKDIYSTPSVVYINNQSAAVGYIVETLLERNPELPVLRFFKRSFGEDKPLFFDCLSNPWYPETIAALVLKKLKYDAESYTGSTIDGAVITVPAHFNDLQRKTVINAAILADLPIMGLVEEPVAAALHYGVKYHVSDQLILVYDLGGGTFDATLLTLDHKGVYVLAKEGITDLGGKEFDEILAVMLIEQYKRHFKGDMVLNASTSLQLRRISEEIKIELSLPNVSMVRKPILMGNQAFEVTIFRRDFELAIRRMIERTIEVTFLCTDGAGIGLKDISAVMLVGGSSMLPTVVENMKKLFNAPHQKVFLHEPMKAVAFGASLHAAQLGGEAERYNIPAEFRGVTGYKTGIKTLNPNTGRVEVDCLINKNLPLPTKAKRTYYTNSATQTQIRLQVVQYHETNDLIDCGEIVIGPIAKPAINYPIEVTVENTTDGTIKCEVFDPTSGLEIQREFRDKQNASGINLIQQRNLIRGTFINNF